MKSTFVILGIMTCITATSCKQNCNEERAEENEAGTTALASPAQSYFIKGTQSVGIQNTPTPENPYGHDLIDSFVLAYDRDRIPQFTDAGQSLKGLLIDDKIIAMIQDPKYKNLSGVYLYLAKRVRNRAEPIDPNNEYNDGKYTLIAIPAMKSVNNPLKDSLIFVENLEWHDPISIHNPVNEHEIGYQTIK